VSLLVASTMSISSCDVPDPEEERQHELDSRLYSSALTRTGYLPRVHGKALRSDGQGSERGYRLLCIVLPRLGAALLALMIVLAVSGPLKAQSLPGLPAISENRSEGVGLRDDFDLSIDGTRLSLDDHQSLRAGLVEGLTSSAAVLTQTWPMNASVVSPEPCTSAAPCSEQLSVLERLPRAFDPQLDREEQDRPAEGSKSPSVDVVQPQKPPDFNQDIYYKNKLEFGLDIGWLPINIPFVFDVFLGDGYTMTPLRYTLVPIFASVRWHVDDVRGWSFLRGNWDMSFTASVTAIPRGPETRYFSYIMGIRRNFVQRNWKIAPYFDGRLGLGNIDAKEPLGVIWSQGQDFTFTVNMGSGVRYNFNPRYSISAGLNWMHISNLYLSEPAFPNYGINVYGPMFGIDVRIGKPHHQASE
jgi:hypothetical protein